MGGSLVHSKTFRINSWHRENGPHYEVGPDEEGDYKFLSYTSWDELKRYCAGFGITPEVWPDFTQYEECIDVPLEEIVVLEESADHDAVTVVPRTQSSTGESTAAVRVPALRAVPVAAKSTRVEASTNGRPRLTNEIKIEDDSSEP